MHRCYTSMKTKLLVTLVFFAGLCVFDAKAAQGRFQHPGIGLNREHLDQLKANVQGGVEPWKTLYDSLTKHDHRFSKKPRIFARRGEGITQIDSPDFDNRCAWDSQTAYYQAIMYEITGEAEYRERALDYVRWFYTHITGGRPHWDSQFRWPLPKPGEYTIRYRCDGLSGIGVINPEDYNTEFEDPETCEKRIYVEKGKLPPTGGEWKEHAFALSAPPNRNLVKLDFRTKGKRLDLEWLKVPK